MMLINEDLRKLWISYTNRNFFLLIKKQYRVYLFLREKGEMWTHTTPTVKVARLIHKSWLVFYYHHPQPKKCSLDRVCKRAHNLCFFSVSIPRISNLEKSNATFAKKGKWYSEYACLQDFFLQINRLLDIVAYGKLSKFYANQTPTTNVH